MHGTLEIIPFDPVDLEECRKFGLGQEGATQVVIVAARSGLEVSAVLSMIRAHMAALNPAVIEFGNGVRAIDDRPNLACIAPLPQNRSERRQDEQRLRSMQKPIGKPWDTRRRGKRL